MFLLSVLLSYLFGCISIIALLVYLYVYYGLDLREIIAEREQYQDFYPLSENEQSKNSTIDTVNYIMQFLFQEMKDTSRIRRYITNKLKIEFNELKNTRIGKLFLQDIIIQSFSLGKECPVLSDIQFEQQERDERGLIKEFVTKLHIDYKDGFSVMLDIKLAFNQTCQLSIKIKRIQGRLRLEFRREPFSHWLLVFQDEPLIDLDIKSYLSSRESSQLAHIIDQRIRHTIRRKQIWPNYKIRYRPFFPTSQQPLSTEASSVINSNLILGKFHIEIQHCDRLSIPYAIFNKENSSSLFIFLTIGINKQMCKDYLRINRDQWIKQEIEFIPNVHKIRLKEVLYMDHIEILIEELDPIPNEIEDLNAFKQALEDKNIFLLQIQNQKIKQLEQTNLLLKPKSTNKNERKIKILVGIPLLHYVQVPYVNETIKTVENEELLTTVQQPIQDIDPSIEHQKNSSVDMINLIMMNADMLPEFQAKATLTRKPATYVEFKDKFEFPANENDQYLNICLWCKPTLDFDMPSMNKKLILLGYTTISLSEVVLDAHMSFKRETQMTLNFQSPNTKQSNLKDYIKDPIRKNLVELSKHKNYDDNMAHGFVTVNIRHEPKIEKKLNHESEKEEISSMETVKIQNEPLTTINEEQESSSSKSTNHLFEDQPFSVGTCYFCSKTIWMKSARQCRTCLVTVHKKCEYKYNRESICTQESIRSKSAILEENQLIEDSDSISNMDQTREKRSLTSSLIDTHSPVDTLIRHSGRIFGNKSPNRPSTIPGLLKHDEFDNSHTGKRSVSNPSSSKLVNAASSAYNKFLDFKTKRSTLETKKPRSSSVTENISEDDLQDIIKKCLTDENVDMTSLENLFHEKAVDRTALYAKVNKFGSELFLDLPLEERKQKLENEISRVQHEIELQNRIRDELILEYNDHSTNENRKKKIVAAIMKVDEKVQAFGALTLLYCTGFKHCCSPIEIKDDHPNINSKSSFDDKS